MAEKNHKELYRAYLDDVKLMQLATSRDHRPWLCNVWYVMDDEDNVYWISRETRRHSEDIAHNPHAACTFHKWFDSGLGEKGQAVVIAGEARKLRGNECRKPYELYTIRHPNLPGLQALEDFENETGHHFFYVLSPKEIMWWDEKNFPENPRQMLHSR